MLHTMKTLVMLFIVLGCALVASCSTPVALSPAGQSPTNPSSGYQVGVTLASNPAGASRNLIADTNVTSVVVNALLNGTSVGSGTLTKQASSWTGSFSVSQLGQITFNAYAENSSSQVLWFGSSSTNITGSGTAITIAMSSFVPTNVSATAGAKQITLSWTAVTGATSYKIYWSNSSSLTTANGTAISVSGTSYTHTGLTWTQPYYYLVTAVNSAHESVASSVLKASANIQWTNYTSTQGLPSSQVSSIAVSGTNIYLGTIGGGVAVSTNSGSTWTVYSTASGLTDSNVYGVYLSGSNLYASTSSTGLFLSTNGGSSWTKPGTSSSDSVITGGLFATTASSSLIVADGVSGLALSTDSGSTWTDFTTGNFAAGAECSTLSGSNLYVGTGGYGVEVSSNNGSSWTNISGMGNAQILGIYVASGTIYVGTSGGLSVTSNSGSTWQNYTTTQGLGSNTVYGVWALGSDILASTTGGLSASNDGGATWVNYTTSNGLAGNSSRVVVVSGSTIYVGTTGGLSVGN